MADTVIIVDANAIQNLWGGGGEIWDRLIKGSDRVVITKVVLKELNRIPVTIPKRAIAGGEFIIWSAQHER